MHSDPHITPTDSKHQPLHVGDRVRLIAESHTGECGVIAKLGWDASFGVYLALVDIDHGDKAFGKYVFNLELEDNTFAMDVGL